MIKTRSVLFQFTLQHTWVRPAPHSTGDEGELNAALSACCPLIVRNPGFRAVLQCKRLLVDTVRAEEEREHCCRLFWVTLCKVCNYITFLGSYHDQERVYHDQELGLNIDQNWELFMWYCLSRVSECKRDSLNRISRLAEHKTSELTQT